jgi:hypothetical protein
MAAIPPRLVASLVLALGVLGSSSAAAVERYALSVFHFNLQYVAGGMVGFAGEPNPETDLDNDAIEDLIITESFAPVIDLFERHPSWGTDIELQGYFLDVLAERHPAVLAKLRKLAKSGQIDVVSFHYSDQLFIAYPAADWERSQALTRETFEKHDVPLSRSVFCQEGQSGEGLARRMAERGYRNMVWPKNLWIFQHGDFEPAPLYRFGDGFLVVGGKGARFSQGSTEVELTWTFLDDGELLATNDFNPYFPDLFRHSPEAVKEYEDRLLALEADGWDIATVDEYVDRVKDRVPLADPPPLLDGTWQPGSTNGVSKWLGNSGLWPGERDNHVRSLNALGHRELVAAETAATAAGLDARAELDAAWRLLFLGQVTDASGINPFRGEIEYGIAHTTESLRIARDVIRRTRHALGAATLAIDPGAGSIDAGGGDPLRGTAMPAPPLEISVVPEELVPEASWELVEPGHYRVALRFAPSDWRETTIRFPGELADEFVTTRALLDSEPAVYRRSQFTFEQFHLPLPTGMVSLGPNRFVIQDQAFTKLAAEISRSSGDVSFRDATLPMEEPSTWVFHLVDGSAEQAVEAARRINVERRLAR